MLGLFFLGGGGGGSNWYTHQSWKHFFHHIPKWFVNEYQLIRKRDWISGRFKGSRFLPLCRGTIWLKFQIITVYGGFQRRKEMPWTNWLKNHGEDERTRKGIWEGAFHRSHKVSVHLGLFLESVLNHCPSTVITWDKIKHPLRRHLAVS